MMTTREQIIERIEYLEARAPMIRTLPNGEQWVEYSWYESMGQLMRAIRSWLKDTDPRATLTPQPMPFQDTERNALNGQIMLLRDRLRDLAIVLDEGHFTLAQKMSARWLPESDPTKAAPVRCPGCNGRAEFRRVEPRTDGRRDVVYSCDVCSEEFCAGVTG